MPASTAALSVVDVRTYVRHSFEMKRSATDLRAHLYEVLDHVATTGEPVHVMRGDVELCIVRARALVGKKSKPRVLADLVVGDPDALIHSTWSWTEGKDL